MTITMQVSRMFVVPKGIPGHLEGKYTQLANAFGNTARTIEETLPDNELRNTIVSQLYVQLWGCFGVLQTNT